jgi:hypothetical protein
MVMIYPEQYYMSGWQGGYQAEELGGDISGAMECAELKERPTGR